MTIAQRFRLLAFGLVTWVAGMSAAAADTVAVVAAAAPAMAGIGAGLFATALLPGRMARFS
jgi:hypothetical protein